MVDSDRADFNVNLFTPT